MHVARSQDDDTKRTRPPRRLVCSRPEQLDPRTIYTQMPNMSCLDTLHLSIKRETKSERKSERERRRKNHLRAAICQISYLLCVRRERYVRCKMLLLLPLPLPRSWWWCRAAFLDIPCSLSVSNGNTPSASKSRTQRRANGIIHAAQSFSN